MGVTQMFIATIFEHWS